MKRKTIRETEKFRLYIASNLHAFLQSKVGGRPKSVTVKRAGGDFGYLRNLSDAEFDAAAVIEFGCGVFA